MDIFRFFIEKSFLFIVLQTLLGLGKLLSHCPSVNKGFQQATKRLGVHYFMITISTFIFPLQLQVLKETNGCSQRNQ